LSVETATIVSSQNLRLKASGINSSSQIGFGQGRGRS
jgi:hypothetical protein